MSNMVSNSLAQGVSSSVENTQFLSAASVVPRKIVIIGTYDPAKTTVVDEIPVLITGAADAASKFGFGSMIHRLAIYAEKGSRGVETWVVPQSEVTGNKAVGEIDFTGSTGIKAGTLYIYIAGELVTVQIPEAATVENIADAVVAAINAKAELPVTAAKHAVTFEVDITAKMKGTYGNFISIYLNRGDGQVLPTGITAAITAMSTGSGVPDIDDALNGLGIGDDVNEKFITDFVHGYGLDSSTLSKISAYVGLGDTKLGCYDPLVHKPMRGLTGDTTVGSAGLSAILAIGNANKLDRANGCVCVPGSINHPSEIAALVLGICAKTNNKRAEENYKDIVLSGIWPAVTKADNWCSEYDNRDLAVKAGISPTRVVSGYVRLQNVVTFYHPDNVAQDSNGYRTFSSISKIQNMMHTIALNFEQPKWTGVTIVADKMKVTDPDSKQKARDIKDVIADYIALTDSFMRRAWIYDDKFSKDALKQTGAVAVRPGGNGFNVLYKFILSGEGDIFNNESQFDTSIAMVIGG